MGTPDFSVPLFNALVESDNFEVVATYCMPDKPKGRGKKLQPTPVKQASEKVGIEVRTPASFKNNDEELEILRAFRPDFLVVVAYGLILSRKILDIPRIAAVNLHASILPKHRGPSPIHHAILNGDPETGNTAMLMNVKMDEGDILAIDRIAVENNDNLESLHDKLSIAGAKFLPDILQNYAENKIIPIKQDHTQATYTCKISPAMAKIDWAKPAIDIERLIRAMSPFPGAWFEANNQRIKVFKASLDVASKSIAGTILTSDSNSGLSVCCGDGKSLSLLELQRPGKSKLKTSDFLRGFKFESDKLF